MKDWLIAIGMVFGILGVFGGMVLGIGKLTDPGPRPVPVYSTGDFVQSLISGQRGQVVRQICYRGTESCYYDVRFVGLSMTTSTSLLGPDGPISTEPLSLVQMSEFELMPYKGN
jgi:hypothetical protein